MEGEKTQHAKQEKNVTASSGTLAGASDESLQKFLGRRQGPAKLSQSSKRLKGHAAGILPALVESEEGTLCGAPAGNLSEEVDAAKPKAEQTGRSRVEDRHAGPLLWQASEAYQQASDDEDDESDMDEWEYADAFNTMEETPNDDPGLVISLGEGHQEEQPSKQRRRFTKEEILAAAMVHQCHVLCLISHAQMLDKAAANAVVQAAAYSLLPATVLTDFQLGKPGLKCHMLESSVKWFEAQFKATEVPKAFTVEEAAQLKEEGGAAACMERLRNVAAEKAGSSEELVALFVAILRACGCLVRLVRALDPLPWRPSMSELMAPQHRKQQRRKQVNQSRVEPAKKAAKEARRGGKGSGTDTPNGHAPGTLDEPKTRKRRRGGNVDAKEDAPSGQKEALGTEADGEAISQIPETSQKGRGRGTGRGRNSRGSAKKGRGRGSEKANGETAVKTEPPAISDGLEKVKKEEDDLQEPEKRARKGKGDIEFENQLAMAMLSSTRPETPGHREADAEAKPEKEAKLSRQRMRGRVTGRGVAITSLQQASAGSYPDQMADTWAEVYCDGEDEGRGRWVHVHPLFGHIDKPESVEGASIRFGPLAYVVAFSGGGAKDITSRYVADFRLALKARGPCKQWWEETLRPLRSAEVEATNRYMTILSSPKPNKTADLLPAVSALSQGPGIRQPKAVPKIKEAKARVAREDQELERRVQRQQSELPTTLDAFRHHKLYVLQRHISRYDAIRPGAVKAGLHKGEPFYQRADISELHTKDKWIQQGLEVKPEEASNPFKVVAKRGSKKNQAPVKDAGDAEEAEEEQGDKKPSKSKQREIPTDESQQTWLYGKWQCSTWQAPRAEGGIVPKNERGSVQCPPLAACLPEGTRQISKPRIVAVCKRLDVDYGMAMTGFDIRGGRSIPHFEGVVVCEEFADQVEQEWEAEQERIAERQAQKQLQEARTTWISLLRAMFMRLGLQEKEAARKSKGQAKKASSRSQKHDESSMQGPDDADKASEPQEEEKGQQSKSRASSKRRTGKAKKTTNGRGPRAEAEDDKHKPHADVEDI